MEKQKSPYLVKKHGDTQGKVIFASSGNQAKRLYCKERGIRPSDVCCGISNLSAHKLILGTPGQGVGIYISQN